jgi:ATP-dependent RNA helicase DeaD
MARLRGGTAELLIATDVAARGLDIEQLTHVVNYDVPSAPESYVHRIGRVGRAGREGIAITLAEPREHYMLRNIERLTGQKIEIAKIPSVDDLKARRLDLTRQAIHEAALGDDLDRFRVVVESLTDEFDLMDVALAAVKLAHVTTTGPEGNDENIPEVAPKHERPSASQAGARRPGKPVGRPHDRPRDRPRSTGAGMTRVFIGAGRDAGIRPQDLVGAIANEAGLSGKEIGTIEIAERFSLVEVPETMADGVIASLRGSTIKGKRPTVRREKF